MLNVCLRFEVKAGLLITIHQGQNQFDFDQSLILGPADSLRGMGAGECKLHSNVITSANCNHTWLLGL